MAGCQQRRDPVSGVVANQGPLNFMRYMPTNNKKVCELGAVPSWIRKTPVTNLSRVHMTELKNSK